MSDSELAFNQYGEPFEVPQRVTGWRPRRLKGTRGQPELVYGPDGPVTLDVHATLEDLRDAVGAGRFRLDPIDDHGKVVPDAPIAYAQVIPLTPDKPVEPANEPQMTTEMTSVDLALREMSRATMELARTNSELAKSIVSKQPDVMLATAEILRAADGAGLPRREPMAYSEDEDEDEDIEDEHAEAAPPSAINPIALLQEVKPLLAMIGVDTDKVLAACGVRLPTAAKPKTAVNGNAPVAARPRRAIAATTQKQEQASTEQTAPPSEPESFVAADPTAHVLAIQAQLAPEEQAFVQRAIQQLKPTDLIEWRDRLAQMPVEEAVAEIRAEIETRKQKPEET
jgi:hypothetical protein